MEGINQIYQEDQIYNFKIDVLSAENQYIEGDVNAELIIFFATENKTALSDNLKSFLMKLLSAVKHSQKNTLIVNDLANIKFQQVLKNKNAKNMIVFGSTRKDIGINLNLKRYKMYSLHGIDCLFADRLDILKDDKQRKAALWTLMKKMFNVS